MSQPSSRTPSGQTWLWLAILLSAVLHAAVAAVLWRTERPYANEPDARAVFFELVHTGTPATGELPRHDSLPPSSVGVASPPAPPDAPAVPASTPTPPRPTVAPTASPVSATRHARQVTPSQADSHQARAHRSSPTRASPNRRRHQSQTARAPATGSATEATSARNAASPGRTPATRPPSAAAAGQRTAERAYLTALQRAIARHQHYPAGARRHGQTGVATLAFVIESDGRLGQIRLAQSSGHASLDQAALQALARLGRFDPIPQSIGRTRWSLRIPIRFDLQ